ncbi:MAG: hypothetical protein H0X17_00150 [Deltaproteobacteria bacterium]|nr:hypothetical protein [Deltaproteobacteria bacterium]
MNTPLLATLALAALSGCRPDPVFTCTVDDDCGGATSAGHCEATGACSFADPSCPSGWRYGDLAEDAHAGACVAVNLLSNPTFETGLAGWAGNESSLALSDMARTGTAAVLVCANAGASFFTLVDQPAAVQDATPGSMFTATLWVRAMPGSPGQLVRLSIDERATGGIDSSSPQIALGDDAWQLVQTSHAVQVTGNVGLAVRATAQEAGACFIADDATLTPGLSAAARD